MLTSPEVRIVRKLGIFMFNLIQKNSSKFVTTNMYMCELPVTSMINILIMFKSTKILLNIETVRLEVYPAEGPMLKAPVAPRALVDIVRCLMSRPRSMQDDVRSAVPRMSTGT
jgi:hypothetical protein